MGTIIPESEKIKKAIKWISAERQQNPDKSIILLIEDAALRFDLSPKEEEFLRIFFEKKTDDSVIL